MRFATYRHSGAVKAGAGLGDGRWVDLAVALRGAQGRLREAAGAPSLAAMIGPLHEAGEAALGLLREALARGEGVAAESEIRLMAPIPRPAKNVFCVGRNYLDHVAEGDRTRGVATKVPEHPQFFTKPPTAVIGPGDPIPRHAGITDKLDYEVELAIVIGRRGADIPKERALEHVFGYTVLNDVTARDLQRRHEQWFKGKGLDGTCPMGPSIVHASALRDPQVLAIGLTVNGEQRQKANTRDMIFDLRTIIHILSQGLTLEPGDIIATGTPSGVGYAMNPPGLLEVGDRVEATVEGIGTLTNSVA